MNDTLDRTLDEVLRQQPGRVLWTWAALYSGVVVLGALVIVGEIVAERATTAGYRWAPSAVVMAAVWSPVARAAAERQAALAAGA